MHKELHVQIWRNIHCYTAFKQPVINILHKCTASAEQYPKTITTTNITSTLNQLFILLACLKEAMANKLCHTWMVL
jgi:hypothetical protein